MKWSSKQTSSLVVWIALLGAFALATPVKAADPLQYAACDLRAVYLFDNADDIDWPTLYYLNDVYGIRIDLANVQMGSSYQEIKRSVIETELHLHSYILPDSGARPYDSVLASLTGKYPVDLVIIAPLIKNSPTDSLSNLVMSASVKLGAGNIYKLGDTTVGKRVQSGSIYLNTREKGTRYRERMEREIPKLFSWYRTPKQMPERLMRYDLVWSSRTDSKPQADFIAGLPPIRLSRIIDSALTDGSLKTALIRKARNYESFLSLAHNSIGRKRADYILTAHKELVTLSDQCRIETKLASIPRFLGYLAELNRKLQRAVVQEIGLTWNGEIILRDSPDGPKVKFRAELGADGPAEIELDAVRFKPYWDTTSIDLDTQIKKIQPHQSIIKEYLVSIDRKYLEAQKPESLLFAADVVYGKMPITLYSAVPIWQSPDLSVKFEPGFKFIPPVAQLVVDRVVNSMAWKATLTKPTYYYGKVDVKIETPRGMFAGAYQTERKLEKGQSLESIRIPFTVSNLFELGIQRATISLLVNGRTIAADTGIIRIAACHVEDTTRIGFLPDTTGQLEDIMRMTDAGFQPLTERTLVTGDLEAYDVILIGSGAFRAYPQLRELKGRLEDFIRSGGRLVLFGQPSAWPEGVLPVGCSPGMERVRPEDILNRGNVSNIMAKPYAISDNVLFDGLAPSTKVASAVVTPAENILVTPTGGALLSVTRIGTGELIYCGLPLVDMISHLNIEAIHLFANLLNH
jgi:hypothetical protein